LSDSTTTTITLAEDDAALVIRGNLDVEFLIPHREDHEEVERYIQFLTAAGIFYTRGGPALEEFIKDVIGDDDLTNISN
jgi:hypothetical protein